MNTVKVYYRLRGKLFWTLFEVEGSNVSQAQAIQAAIRWVARTHGVVGLVGGWL